MQHFVQHICYVKLQRLILVGGQTLQHFKCNMRLRYQNRTGNKSMIWFLTVTKLWRESYTCFTSCYIMLPGAAILTVSKLQNFNKCSKLHANFNKCCTLQHGWLNDATWVWHEMLHPNVATLTLSEPAGQLFC